MKRKTAKEKRSDRLLVKFNNKEYERLLSKAKDTPLGRYIRERALGKRV